MSAIIYVHKGDSFYLNDSFKITRQHNPYQKMILLGDDQNKKYAALYNLEFHNIKDYQIANFNYKHYSVNSESYEKFCYERWIIINQFLKTTEYEKIIYSDSDNVLFNDVNELLNNNKASEYNVLYLGNQEVVVPNIFVANQNVFQIISEGIFDFFNQPDHEIEKLIETKRWYIGGQKHFSDMFVLRHILDNNHQIKTANLESKQFCDDFYTNINYNDIKTRIVTKTKKPYLDGKLLFNLHFAADSKKYMSLFS